MLYSKHRKHITYKFHRGHFSRGAGGTISSESSLQNVYQQDYMSLEYLGSS